MRQSEIRQEFISRNLKNIRNLKEVINICVAFEPLYSREIMFSPGHIAKDRKIVKKLRESIALSENKLKGLGWDFLI